MLRDSITDCVREARRQEGCALAATLTAGSRVMISGTANLRPRYIIGTKAVVVRVNKTTATITLGEVRLPPGTGRARFYTGQTIRCPLDALELVEGEEARGAMRCGKCHRPMAGTTAYDGACECGGLIEACE
jgi:hypothetical protein